MWPLRAEQYRNFIFKEKKYQLMAGGRFINPQIFYLMSRCELLPQCYSSRFLIQCVGISTYKLTYNYCFKHGFNGGKDLIQTSTVI